MESQTSVGKASTASNGSKGVVHLWALVWNERDILPFFLEHYRPFVDRFFLYDDDSDDGSVEYLADQPDVELRRFQNEGDSFVEAARDFYNHAWKESRGAADWVIVVNIDELVHHPSPREALAEEKRLGRTIIRPRGWDMVTEDFPREGPLVQTANRGVHSRGMAKLAIFDPDMINEINYAAGRHHANPTGRAVGARETSFDLLHYKHLGEEYLVRRYRELGPRMKPVDRARRLGVQYHQEEAQLREQHQRLLSAARPVLRADMLAEGWLEQPMAGVFEARRHAVKNAKGRLQEVWRSDDPFGTRVDQVYTTTTLPGVIKAWYRHRTQVDQVFPLMGRTLLVLFDPRTADQAPVEIMLDAADPKLVVVDAGVWHGFRACGPEPSRLLHMNNRAINLPLIDEVRVAEDHPGIPYQWPGSTTASK